ncbi:MAG: SAM-dependent chlorinase/fluorinase [Pseudomonadota bacterium]
MPIALFTDFGSADLYVGQVKAVIAAKAPGVAVLDLLHDAPNYEVECAAHLLAALAPQFPAGTVFLAVVDPGVGTRRGAIVVEADGRGFVGPDNGLLSIVYQRAAKRRCRSILWRPSRLSSSFHGRDLFAPVAARLATEKSLKGWLGSQARPKVMLPPEDLERIIYIDHFGNAVTGIRFSGIKGSLRVGRRSLRYARTFADARGPFWYENSLGLVEIAQPRGSAARKLGLRVGYRIRIAR